MRGTTLTLILIAGEAGHQEDFPDVDVPPSGIVRVQRREGATGISTTLDRRIGRPYWDQLSPKDHPGPTLREVLDETAKRLAAQLDLPL